MTKHDKLKNLIINDFKANFDYIPIDEDFEAHKNGFYMDYQDYDLNHLADYHNSPLIEMAQLTDDGRCSFISVYTELSFDDYGI